MKLLPLALSFSFVEHRELPELPVYYQYITRVYQKVNHYRGSVVVKGGGKVEMENKK